MIAGIVAVCMGFILLEDSGYEILVPGNYFQGETEAVRGELWHGIYATSAGYELRTVELVVKAAHSLADRQDGERTGSLIIVAGEEGKLLFLLQSEEEAFFHGSIHTELVNTGDLQIGVSIQVNDSCEVYTTEAGLFLSDGHVSQRLSDVYPDSHGEGVSVVWVGDLDGDNRIDVVLDDQPHYATKCFYRLFLSSEADPGSIVKEVARFSAVAC